MKILLVDDNPFDRALVVRELNKEFPTISVHEVLDAEGMATAFAAADFDLVITDYQLQWTTGSEVLRSVKLRFPEMPVIMFTGTGNELIAVEAICPSAGECQTGTGTGPAPQSGKRSGQDDRPSACLPGTDSEFSCRWYPRCRQARLP